MYGEVQTKKKRGREFKDIADEPAAVAFPVRILTWVSSSDIRRCASSAIPGWAWVRSVPHLSQLWALVIC